MSIPNFDNFSQADISKAKRNALHCKYKDKNYINYKQNRKRINNYRKVNRQEIRKQERSQKLKKNFGIDITQYEQMFIAQNGKCACCCKEEIKKIRGRIIDLAVDHNHKTNEIRELLCVKCNTALGLLDDSVENIEKLLSYRRKFN